MAFSSGNNSQFMSEINVTPFVDVMLVLLIIFMVTAPMMVQGVDVVLPETTSGPLPSENEPLIISVTKANDVYINNYKVEYAFLREKLKGILENNKNREVYLRADKDIKYGFVIQIMAEIKSAGVQNLGMVTDPEDKTVQ